MGGHTTMRSSHTILGMTSTFLTAVYRPETQLTPISPSEASKIIQTDLIGNVTFVDRNTAVVVPNAPGAGVLLGGLDGEIIHNGSGNGKY